MTVCSSCGRSNSTADPYSKFSSPLKESETYGNRNNTVKNGKILLLATLSGGYRGADMVGQGHMDYPPNTYILPVMSAAIFPPKFYIDAFSKRVRRHHCYVQRHRQPL
jgi:hypothetical protein